MLSSMLEAGGLALVAAGQGELAAGESVEVCFCEGARPTEVAGTSPARTRAGQDPARPQSEYARDGAIGSKQVAEITLPRAELESVWSPEYLERLPARTGASSPASLSAPARRVRRDSREVVVLTRPFVLLRFHKPSTRRAERRRSAGRSTEDCSLRRPGAAAAAWRSAAIQTTRATRPWRPSARRWSTSTR